MTISKLHWFLKGALFANVGGPLKVCPGPGPPTCVMLEQQVKWPHVFFGKDFSFAWIQLQEGVTHRFVRRQVLSKLRCPILTYSNKRVVHKWVFNLFSNLIPLSDPNCLWLKNEMCWTGTMSVTVVPVTKVPTPCCWTTTVQCFWPLWWWNVLNAIKGVCCVWLKASLTVFNFHISQDATAALLYFVIGHLEGKKIHARLCFVGYSSAFNYDSPDRLL